MTQRRSQARDIRDGIERVEVGFKDGIYQVIKDAFAQKQDIECKKIFAYLCSRLLADR
jgi:hypothetical protein